MPLFDFECLECHERFEELVSSTTIVECPICRSVDVKKLPCAPAVRTGGGASRSVPSFPSGGG